MFAGLFILAPLLIVGQSFSVNGLQSQPLKSVLELQPANWTDKLLVYSVLFLTIYLLLTTLTKISSSAATTLSMSISAISLILNMDMAIVGLFLIVAYFAMAPLGFIFVETKRKVLPVILLTSYPFLGMLLLSGYALIGKAPDTIVNDVVGFEAYTVFQYPDQCQPSQNGSRTYSCWRLTSKFDRISEQLPEDATLHEVLIAAEDVNRMSHQWLLLLPDERNPNVDLFHYWAINKQGNTTMIYHNLKLPTAIRNHIILLFNYLAILFCIGYWYIAHGALSTYASRPSTYSASAG